MLTAQKQSATEAISELEPSARGPGGTWGASGVWRGQPRNRTPACSSGLFYDLIRERNAVPRRGSLPGTGALVPVGSRWGPGGRRGPSG